MLDVRTLKAAYNKTVGTRDALAVTVAQTQNSLAVAIKDGLALQLALVAAKQQAGLAQEIFTDYVSGLVTLALSSVFGDEYSFELKRIQRANKVDIKPILLNKHGKELVALLDSGGVLDIAAFAALIALRALELPATFSILALDEPFKWISEDLRPAACEMFRTVCAQLGLQVLMVTHITELQKAADKVIHFYKDVEAYETDKGLFDVNRIVGDVPSGS